MPPFGEVFRAVEDGFARPHHFVADALLFLERVALRRVQAQIGPEIRYVLFLPELFPLSLVRHGILLPSLRTVPHGECLDSKECRQEESPEERFQVVRSDG